MDEATRMNTVKIAHDMNNALAVINGHCDLILSDLTELDPLREPMQEIRDAGGRAAELTKQLFESTRRKE